MLKKNNIVVLSKKLKLYKIKFIDKTKIIKVYGPLGSLEKDISFLNNLNNFYFINKNYLKSFLSILNKMIIGVTYGWFFILEIFGRGLSFNLFFKDNINYLKIKLGYSHFVIFKISKSIFIKRTKKPQKLLLYSLNYWDLSKLVFQIRNFKKDNSYKIQGIKFFNEETKLKAGKEKQF